MNKTLSGLRKVSAASDQRLEAFGAYLRKNGAPSFPLANTDALLRGIAKIRDRRASIEDEKNRDRSLPTTEP